MSLLVTLPFGLWVALWPQTLAAFFTTDVHVQEQAAHALSYLGWGLAPFAVGMTLYFASQGAHRMHGPMLAGLCRISIAVGLGNLMAHQFESASAYYLSVACAITAFGLIVALSVRPGVWSAASVSKS
jgi:Na+-driven multidrug efflux pump